MSDSLNLNNLNLNEIASLLPYADSLADLATQLHVTEQQLRRFLIQAGYPANYELLCEEMAATGGEGVEGEDFFSAFGLLGGFELLDQAETAKRSPSVASLSHPDRYRVKVPGDQPYLIVFTGDWHIGEAGTDHNLLKRDTLALKEAKDLYQDNLQIIAMGDYIGGYMKSKTPGNKDQVLSPADQREAARALLEAIKPTLIVEGDHDSWHNKHDDEQDWLAEFCRHNRYRFAQWGAQVNFVSASSTFRVVARHRFKGSRRVDPLSPQVKAHEMYGPVEAVALAHVHSNPGAQLRRSARVKEEPFWAVQSGTYKLRDEYAKKLGLGHGEYGVPCILVLPEEGTAVAYDNLEKGLKRLKAALEYID